MHSRKDPRHLRDHPQADGQRQGAGPRGKQVNRSSGREGGGLVEHHDRSHGGPVRARVGEYDLELESADPSNAIAFLGDSGFMVLKPRPRPSWRRRDLRGTSSAQSGHPQGGASGDDRSVDGLRFLRARHRGADPVRRHDRRNARGVVHSRRPPMPRLRPRPARLPAHSAPHWLPGSTRMLVYLSLTSGSQER